MSDGGLAPVHWVGSSRKDLRAFPDAVRAAMGYALFRAQEGKKSPAAKPLKDIVRGSGILEVVEDHDGNTYRLAYTVRFLNAVYVLHAFQKKSMRGIATPKREIELIRSRYATAQSHYEERRHGR